MAGTKSSKKDLENKIAELEERLAKLATQFESRSAPPKPTTQTTTQTTTAPPPAPKPQVQTPPKPTTAPPPAPKPAPKPTRGSLPKGF